MAERMRVTSFIATAAFGRPDPSSGPSPSDAARPIASGPVSEMGRLESRISPDRRRGQPRLLPEMAARTAGGAGWRQDGDRLQGTMGLAEPGEIAQADPRGRLQFGS